MLFQRPGKIIFAYIVKKTDVRSCFSSRYTFFAAVGVLADSKVSGVFKI